jgi:hypothetical protein
MSHSTTLLLAAALATSAHAQSRQATTAAAAANASNTIEELVVTPKSARRAWQNPQPKQMSKAWHGHDKRVRNHDPITIRGNGTSVKCKYPSPLQPDLRKIQPAAQSVDRGHVGESARKS